MIAHAKLIFGDSAIKLVKETRCDWRQPGDYRFKGPELSAGDKRLLYDMYAEEAAVGKN